MAATREDFSSSPSPVSTLSFHPTPSSPFPPLPFIGLRWQIYNLQVRPAASRFREELVEHLKFRVSREDFLFLPEAVISFRSSLQ